MIFEIRNAGNGLILKVTDNENTDNVEEEIVYQEKEDD